MRLSFPVNDFLRAALLAVMTLAACATGSAATRHAENGSAAGNNAALPAGELLRQAVANQKIESGDYYAWLDRVQKPRGAVTKLMVNTPHGLLARLVAINDKPLTAEEQQFEEQHLNRLLDEGRMSEKAGKQREEERRAERVLNALPDAFLCQYASAEHEERQARLECDPNPEYNPPSYELQVLAGMRITILIDREELRMLRLEGTLFKDVNFGWGLVGHLYRGGHIEMSQSRISGKNWGIHHMQFNFDGRAILFKHLHLEITEQQWDYHSVPAMDVAQSLDFLRSHAAKLEASAKLNPPKEK
jgi:hypothetical protein